MTDALSLELLLTLDDAAARCTALATLAGQVLASPALRPLFPGLQAPLPPLEPDWVDALAAAAAGHWLASSGLGWMEEIPGAAAGRPGIAALLGPELPAHRRTAHDLYLWALPHHCHHGDVVLLNFMLDRTQPWGERLAAASLDGDALFRTTGDDPAERGVVVDRILGKLHWLAPGRVAEVARHHRRPPPQAGGAAGSEPPDAANSNTNSDAGLAFRFSPDALLGLLEPRIGDALHRALSEGSTSLCGFTLGSAVGGEAALVETGERVAHLTESLLLQGLGRLSPAERRMAAAAFARAMPFLRQALGDFVVPTLQRLHKAGTT